MSPRDLRALLVGGTVVLAAWTATRGVPGARAWIEGRELEVERLAQEVARGRRVAADLQLLSDSIARMERVAEALPRVLLLGGDPGTAGFDLTRRLTVLLSTFPTFVHFIRPEPMPPGGGPLAPAAVEASLETDLRGLLAILRAVDDDPSLTLRSLRIHAADPASSPQEQERLQADLTVGGWYRPPAPPAEAAIPMPEPASP